jgi:deoxyribodipyrimidine photolyase-related protein
MKTLRLVLGDQLNPEHSWFKEDDRHCIYVLMEIRQETDHVLHHVQKLLGVLGAMRRFAERLEDMGKRVRYIALDDPHNSQRFDLNLSRVIEELGIDRFEYQLPDEHRIDIHLRDFCEGLSIPFTARDTEHFLTTRNELGDFFEGKRRFLMESFYRRMRTRHRILIDGNAPAGGKWNFDAENRSKWRGQVAIPPPRLFRNDCSDVHSAISRSGVSSFGSCDPSALIWPQDWEQARTLLRYFAENLLPHFGRFQDAMTSESWSLFHSRLSFALNLKIISPMEVVSEAINAWEKDPENISLPQIEGFVRQIIGWREYMRGVYWALMPGYESKNYLEHSRPLPDYYWTGSTNMRCMRYALEQSLSTAYAHHIQRLMVTGNFALISGVAVDEIDRWYLGVYIDAVQWVEITNTRGMSQYADGGIVATKPYAASAAYMNRMSDYCRGCHYDYKLRHVERGCPFNSLYWHFFHRHRGRLSMNPRLGMVYRNLDRMDETERHRTFKRAEYVIDHLEDL